jgi:hypothetical protein
VRAPVVSGGSSRLLRELARVAMRGPCYGDSHSTMLTKWFYPTRLETRTKESNICASMWVSNLYAQ